MRWVNGSSLITEIFIKKIPNERVMHYSGIIYIQIFYVKEILIFYATEF